jgi:hypothetical protein
MIILKNLAALLVIVALRFLDVTVANTYSNIGNAISRI